LERPRKNRGNSVFKSAWDAVWPVYAIGIVPIIVFSLPPKTDERAHP
jgi:hypothetical protein